MAQVVQGSRMCARMHPRRAFTRTSRLPPRSGTVPKAVPKGQGDKKLQQKTKEKKAPQKQKTVEELEEEMRAMDKEINLYFFLGLLLAIFYIWQLRESIGEYEAQLAVYCNCKC